MARFHRFVVAATAPTLRHAIWRPVLVCHNQYRDTAWIILGHMAGCVDYRLDCIGLIRCARPYISAYNKIKSNASGRSKRMSSALVQEVLEHPEALPPELQEQVLVSVRKLDSSIPKIVSPGR